MELIGDYVLMPQAYRRQQNLMRYLDLFAFTPAPRHYMRRSTSFRSVVATFVLVIIVVVYSIVSLTRWLENKPAVSIATQRSAVGYPNTSMIELGVGFQVYLDDEGSTNSAATQRVVATKAFWNTSFFNIDFYGMYVDALGNFHETQMPSVYTERVEWMGEAAGRKVAMMGNYSDVMLGGLYSRYFDFSSLEMHVHLCDNDTRSDCATLAEIEQVLRNGEFVAATRQATPEGDVIYSMSYTASSTLWQWHEIVLSRWTVVVEPDFLRTFARRTWMFLKRVSELNFIIAVWQPEEKVARQPLTLRFLLSADQTIESRNVQSFLDLLGSIAALFSAIFGPLSLICRFHNRQKFFRRHPRWDNLNDELEWLGPNWWDREDAPLGGGDEDDDDVAASLLSSPAAPAGSDFKKTSGGGGGGGNVTFAPNPTAQPPPVASAIADGFDDDADDLEMLIQGASPTSAGDGAAASAAVPTASVEAPSPGSFASAPRNASFVRSAPIGDMSRAQLQSMIAIEVEIALKRERKKWGR